MFDRRLLVSLLVLWSASARADDAADFIEDARLFQRVVACGGTDPVPDTVDAKTIERHCTEMTRRYQRFNEKYVTPARAFFAEHRPSGLPVSVVYPFGGGDLVG